jgi:hypothetical protein
MGANFTTQQRPRIRRMSNEGLKTEEQIATRLKEHLALIPNITLLSSRRNTRIAGREVDVDFVVEIGGHQHEIVVKVKPDGSPSVLRQAANQLKSIRGSFPDEASFYLAVAPPYISEEEMEICNEEQVGCLDTAGNC